MKYNIQPIENFDDEFAELEQLDETSQDIEYSKSGFDSLIEKLEELRELLSDFDYNIAISAALNSLVEIMKSFYDDDFTKHQPTQEEYIEKQKEFEEILPTLQSKLPLWHTIPVQKLVTELQHNLINDGATNIVVANKGKKNEITSYVLATYDEVDGATSLTEFDRQVHDAVSSLWEYGHESRIITPDMVARAMNHRTETEKVSPQFKGAVTKSIEKMRRIHITLDASEEIKKRKCTLDGERVDTFKVDDYLLSLKGIEVGAGGKTVKGYLIQTEPLLLTYAKRTKQLSTIPAYLLDIKKVDKKTGKLTTVSATINENRVAVKGYILRRIEIMRNDRENKKPKQSNIILFSTLFEETGIPQDSNAANTKEFAFTVLDNLKAVTRIKGYTKRKNRKSIDAVIIDL